MTENDTPSETLIQLIKYGTEVFGNKENFTSWLEWKSFFFDKKAPAEFMNTADGIKFIDERLAGIASGDNA